MSGESPYVLITHLKDSVLKKRKVILPLGINKGEEYTGKESDEVQGDEQFEIDDNRSLDKMYKDIEDEGLQPVLNDYLYV